MIRGFFDLDRRREHVIHAGMGGTMVQPKHVPLVEIEAYCRMRGWRGVRVDDFVYYVGVLDEVKVDIDLAKALKRPITPPDGP